MIRRLAGVLLLAALTVGLAPPAREHCAPKQEQATHHHDAPADAPPQAGCDHCPPDQCATTAPCGGSVTGLAIAAGTPALAAASGSRQSAAWRPVHSRSIRPPTPPPTALL